MTAGKIKLMAAVGLAVLAVIWILQNSGSVQTKFLFVTVTMPQPALLAITLLVGGRSGDTPGVEPVGEVEQEGQVGQAMQMMPTGAHDSQYWSNNGENLWDSY